MRLASLPPLLRADDALTRVLGDPAGVVAVPESARAVAIAALATWIVLIELRQRGRDDP